ncbi:MAG: DoxX family membrane protein [Chloroflexota bacterium]
MQRFGLMLFSAMFVYGGWGQATQPTYRAEQGRKIGLPVSDELVRGSGAAMILGGLALQLTAVRRLAALGLALQLAIVSFIGHRFWEHEPGPQRVAHQINLYKNLSLLGGLLYLAGERS